MPFTLILLAAASGAVIAALAAVIFMLRDMQLARSKQYDNIKQIGKSNGNTHT